ncbi:hypothetical protein KR018_011119 [Drosophila ironensis]|nr:hypothetical protein KR018_011119 [Drosophila ironensis]
MRSAVVILLIAALALNLVQARNVNYSNSQQIHGHSIMWPCDVADYPQSFILMHKVEKRLERIENEQVKNIIKEFVVNELRRCKMDGQMDEHCVKRAIGYSMSFISHQLEQARYQQ